MFRVGILTRTSTRCGSPQQLEECRKFVSDRQNDGWALAKAYADAGPGSRQGDAIVQLLRDIKSGLLDVVVVSDLTRLARSAATLRSMMQALEEQKVQVVTLD
ncbi:MAG: recombinase family protein [Planctomycetia bacterium]|nr:recombinase family protein [Planctomycetia bacterium]